MNHNSGTVLFSTSATIVPDAVVFNHVTFAGIGVSHNLSLGFMTVAGVLTLSDGNIPVGAINSGTILAQGNIVASSQGKSGSALIKISVVQVPR